MTDKTSEKEIQNFFAAFANFGIVREELFSVLVQRYEALPSQGKDGSKPDISASFSRSFENANSSASNSPLLLRKADSFFAKDSPHNSPQSLDSPPRSPPFSGVVKNECQAMLLILRVWLSQSGALYKRQHPQFFRSIATFLADVNDPRMNGLKLQLIKNKSASELDSALPFYQAITQARQTSPVKEGFEKSFKGGLFNKYSVREVAEGITFVMFRVYSSIGPSELHDGSWQGNERMIRAPHIHALSVLFNRISTLCIWEILGAESQEKRVENFSKCLELTKTLKKMNNFEGMASVASVFSNAAISRLKPLWSCLDSKALKKVKKFENYFKPQKNYKSYSSLLAKSNQNGPLLPWLAPKLRELRYMYDGNAKTTPEGFVCYSFLQMLGQSVNKYLEHKKTPYNVPVPDCDLVHIFEAVPNLDADYVEDVLYGRSQELFA
eukprot:CAMPEP_0201528532 /NCGR_PEP_ID=MMETSP0161_2-20130828/38527_1 /ASSEMBLY_ACC=CAM_ASM_000251 /TAXON_ID=180227 /ORGANISM="Neoparamoeba aestuarina, Strain SoJaBio B1-5/56/2" /LENGTH=438 /DNA_ID=CAMNT_0047929835 /DNA_START=273 /DNA_END=1589 /DNA_ORIENTATION=-